VAQCYQKMQGSAARQAVTQSPKNIGYQLHPRCRAYALMREAKGAEVYTSALNLTSL